MLCGEMGGKPLQAMTLGLVFSVFSTFGGYWAGQAHVAFRPYQRLETAVREALGNDSDYVPNWKTSPIDRVSSCMLLPILDCLVLLI